MVYIQLAKHYINILLLIINQLIYLFYKLYSKSLQYVIWILSGMNYRQYMNNIFLEYLKYQVRKCPGYRLAYAGY